MSNKESVTKGGRAVAIFKQGTMREHWDVKGIKRERDRQRKRERNIKEEMHGHGVK